jgi:hypothetical protein
MEARVKQSERSLSGWGALAQDLAGLFPHKPSDLHAPTAPFRREQPLAPLIVLSRGNTGKNACATSTAQNACATPAGS